METQSPEKQKMNPGPVPGPPMRTYTINMEEVDGEWAKRQPGGMAALIRRLVREARAKTEGGKQ